MLTAQDMSYDEARNLHSKWLKHQAFMAELQSNKEWLDKIQKVPRVDPRIVISQAVTVNLGFQSLLQGSGGEYFLCN